MNYPLHLLKLIDVLKRLPGVGSKSAERFAFEMIAWPEARLNEMAEIIKQTATQLKQCLECGSLIDLQGCAFCSRAHQRSKALCIVANARDLFSIEATREYRGLYHVLGALLSPLDGIHPNSLNIDKLKERIQRHQIEEIIIALDSTLEGDATALYLRQELAALQVPVSRLAFGLPMGSSLDYVDGGTLARALSARGRF